MPQYKERLYIINTPGWKITNCSRQQSRPPHTRSDARGRTDEKFAPFALSRNSSSATYSCLWCLRWKTLDNTLNCYPYLKRPILHIKAVPKAIRERLSNKSIFFTTLPLLVGHAWKQRGFKSWDIVMWAASWEKKSIYKHSLCSAAPLFTIPPKKKHPPRLWQQLMVTMNDPKHLKDKKTEYIFTINCSVVQTRTPCRL